MARSKILLCVIPLLLAAAAGSLAQDDSEVLIDGRPLENVIVDRDTYVRIVAESRFSEDERNLITEDVGYARFPSKIYETKIGFNNVSRFRMEPGFAFWENDQGLDVIRKSLSVRVPMTESWSIHGRYLQQEEQDYHKDYYDIAAGGYLKAIYTYTQYQYAVDEDGNRRSQLYQYLSWQSKSGHYRAGTDGSASSEPNTDKLASWHARVFMTLPVMKDTTYLHLSGMYLDYEDFLDYIDMQAALYRLIGEKSSIRLAYRYYEDSDDLHSHSYGIKAKHYFSPRLGVHAGYRLYDHGTGADLNTFFGGFNLLL